MEEKTLCVAVIEDNEKDVAALQNHFARYEREQGVRFVVRRFRDVELFLTKYKPVYDIIFMDIELPGMDGMNAAHKLRKFDEDVPLLFVTNVARLAIKGYTVGALDYFVKPVEYYELKIRLDRIIQAQHKRSASLIVPVAGGFKKLPTEEICYIETEGHMLSYHTRRDGVLTVRSKEPLKTLEAQLAGQGFARCSVSCLVNLRYCTQLRGNELTIGGEVVYITRGKRKQFIEMLSKYFREGK